jgi:hypothetical protein
MKVFQMKWDPKRRAWVRGLSRFTVMMIALVVAMACLAGTTQFDLTTAVKGILPSANGGTNSAFFAVTGPTAVRTFTYPDANGTVMMTTTGVSATQLPNPSASTLGGIQSKDCTGTGHVVTISTAGVSPVRLTLLAQTFLTRRHRLEQSTAPMRLIQLRRLAQPASLMLFKNGQLMTQGAAADYQVSGTTITYTSGAKPKTGDVHAYSCRY